MNRVKYNSLPISEKRLNDVRDAKISLVQEHESRDEEIQNKIRERYSLSQEVAILRKQVQELTKAMMEMLQIETMDSENSTEFEEYNAYVEECKVKVKEGFEEEMMQ